jgi:hypothetical protein
MYQYDPQQVGATGLAQLPTWTGYQYELGAPVAPTYTGTGTNPYAGYTSTPVYYTDMSTGQKTLMGYQNYNPHTGTTEYSSSVPNTSYWPGMSTGGVAPTSLSSIPGTQLKQTSLEDSLINWDNTATNVYGTPPANDPFFSMYYMNPTQVSEWNSLLAQIGSLGGATSGYAPITDYTANPLSDYYTVGAGGALTPYNYQFKTYNPTTNAWG